MTSTAGDSPVGGRPRLEERGLPVRFRGQLLVLLEVAGQKHREHRALAERAVHRDLRPPLIWQSWRLMGQAEPRPPYFRVVEASAWRERLEELPEVLVA